VRRGQDEQVQGMVRAIVIAFGAIVWVSAAIAQELGWVQIEARPTEAQAVERAQDYATRLANVNGFALPSGWYAIALGPYDRFTAEQELRRLRLEGAVPSDSFISDGRGFGRRIYGDGLVVLPEQVAAPPAQTLVPAEESLADSRDAERLLTPDERAEVQEALLWEGFYASTIDGSFGPGTRQAMSDWQFARGYEPTGVLSSEQRRALLDGYREVLSSIGMTRVFDEGAGIEIDLPMSLVAFSHYDAPFAHYDPMDASGVRVLLISQSGDEGTLAGLYDIMQTLEIIPLDGPRERTPTSFSITGANLEIVSTTYAELVNGAIKGFTLVWPEGDDKRRNRVLEEMRASFTPTAAVLPDLPLADAEQGTDLLSGLRIRTPERMRSGFFVSADGKVVTSAEAVASCERVTLGDNVDAQVTASDDGLGVALLSPAQSLVPIGFARLQSGTPRLQSDVAVAGYPYGDALSQPTLTYGQLSDLRGLAGEEQVRRLALSAEAGDTGGPVFDATGSVLGVLLPRDTDAQRQLPPDVSFATDAAALATFLSQNGVNPAASDAVDPVAPEDIATLAADMTVRVSCWN
jgi:peptidoglycan hydrolase-like protein with peptidoglycan-binding domain